MSTPTNENSPTGQPVDPGATQRPSPRAFAMGTGFVFQSLGFVFALGACCFWSVSSQFIRPAAAPPDRWAEHFAGDRFLAAAVTVALVTTLIGGMGLVGVGIGLQGERRGSGRTGSILTGLMALIYWAVAIALFLQTGAVAAGLVAAAFAVVTTLLFLLALHSAKVLKKFPPPSDQNVVSGDFYKDPLSRSD